MTATMFLLKLRFALAQLDYEDDFQRGLRIARVRVILDAALAQLPRDERDEPPEHAAD